MKNWNGVGAVEKSKNSKVGDVAATYSSLKTCPATCPLRAKGCYAELGKVGMYVKKLDASAVDADARTLARREAQAIDLLSGKRPLRVHVSGDSRTDATAKIVSAAADRYRARHGQDVWAYTHAWRDVERTSWGQVSVLASVENLEGAAQAMEKGYAPAVVVSEHPVDGKAKRDAATGIKLIPCPAQTRDEVTCAKCKLCWQADRLLADRAAIAFAAHGPRANAVKETVGE